MRKLVQTSISPIQIASCYFDSNVGVYFLGEKSVCICVSEESEFVCVYLSVCVCECVCVCVWKREREVLSLKFVARYCVRFEENLMLLQIDADLPRSQKDPIDGN